MTQAWLLAYAGMGLVAGMAASKAQRVWMATMILSAGAALIVAIRALASGTVCEWQPGLVVCGELLHFRLDGLSALFLALVSMVGGAGAVYAREYWSDAEHPRSARAGRMWWSGLMLCLGLVLITSNGLHFLIAWELFTLSAYFLITLDRQHREARVAGWLYLGASH